MIYMEWNGILHICIGIYSGILFSDEKEENLVMCYNM